MRLSLIRNGEHSTAISTIDEILNNSTVDNKYKSSLLLRKAQAYSSITDYKNAQLAYSTLIEFLESVGGESKNLSHLYTELARLQAMDQTGLNEALTSVEKALQYNQRNKYAATLLEQIKSGSLSSVSISSISNVNAKTAEEDKELILEPDESASVISKMIDIDIREYHFTNPDIINNGGVPTPSLAKKIYEEAKRIKDVDLSERFPVYLEAAKAYSELPVGSYDSQEYLESIAYYSILKGNSLFLKFKKLLTENKASITTLTHIKDSACSYYIESLNLLSSIKSEFLLLILGNYLKMNIALVNLKQGVEPNITGQFNKVFFKCISSNDTYLNLIAWSTVVAVGTASPRTWNQLTFIKGGTRGLYGIMKRTDTRKSIYELLNRINDEPVNTDLLPGEFLKKTFAHRKNRNEKIRSLISKILKQELNFHLLSQMIELWSTIPDYIDLLNDTELESKSAIDKVLVILTPYTNRNQIERTNLLIQAQRIIEEQLVFINENTTYYGRTFFFPLLSRWKRIIVNALEKKIADTMPQLVVVADPPYIVDIEGSKVVNLLVKNRGESTAEGCVMKPNVISLSNEISIKGKNVYKNEIPSGSNLEVPMKLPPAMYEVNSIKLVMSISAIYQGRELTPAEFEFTLEKEPESTLQYEDIPWNDGPIPVEQMFKGRKQILDMLTKHYTSIERDKPYILYGLTRTGKSSILKYLRKALDKRKITKLKECKRHGSREKWFMYQIVDNTEIPITSIPERIIAADTTTLSYAFMLDEKGQAIAVPDKTPSLYAYLPMEDRRYLFPFYINADFELSSNRQEAKRVSVWNEFLFYNIGKKIVSWVASLATKSHPAYLNLLPKEFFAEELEEGKIDRLAYQFNRGYKEALKADAFLRNDEGFVASQNDVLIDESGFAKIIGANDFCKLMSLNKRLIAPDIDCKPLANTNMFTEIEHLHTSNLVNSLLDNKNRYRLLRYWHQISEDKRNDILRHIVSMPRNHKNLFEYIKDIPAYNYGRQSFSLNKLLRSTKCILRLKSLEQIFPILQKLGFCITDTEEYNHPFHDVLKEEIEAYTLHVFDIISQCTSKKAALLNADEKNRLFMHFSSAKYTLKHEQLSKWCLFSNERGNQCVLNNLTHIDSALYGGITAPFVINETEFIVAPKLLGNYMMKEKNQYDKIVINQWESLVDQVGTSEELALSLYKFTSNTYLMAEHEQADEINTNVLLGKPFVFVNKHMMLLSDVIISDVFADNNNIKEIIEHLTEKKIPSSKVTKALSGKPFDCRSTDFEHLNIKENKVLSKVQLTAILDFCAANKDTIFTKYHIVQEESNYMLSPLSDNEVVAYTDDNRLQTFINTNCTNIKLLPSTYANYKSVKGVLTEETLLLRVLEELDSVDKHLASLLPIYHNSVSAVKKCFIGKISCIELRKDSLSENDDYSLQIFKIASTIEKIDKTLYDSIREKIDILADENSTKLIDIQLQHTVEVEGIKYPLSKLLPNEDKLARTVDVLKERLEDKVSSTFADNIFGDEVDSNRASSIFAELNKEQKILENGAQLAFVLEFAKSQKGNDGIKCKVHNKTAIPIACDICKYWLLEGQSFIDDNYILHTEYEDISRYIKIPYTGTNINCTIENSITDYQYVKSELNDDEKNSLLDYILDRYNKGIIPQSSEFATIRKCLGLSHFDYVVSKKFALAEEQIPNLIELWRNKENTDCRTKFLINIFGFHGEDSDIVSVRRYLSDFGNTPNVFTSETLSKMTCAWIVENDMLINDGQFAILQDILLGNDFETLVDFDKMNQCVSSQRPYLSFGNYALYLYPSEIPWKAVIKEAQYTFHTFVEDDIAIKGYTIYVNEDCESEIKDLVT